MAYRSGKANSFWRGDLEERRDEARYSLPRLRESYPQPALLSSPNPIQRPGAADDVGFAATVQPFNNGRNRPAVDYPTRQYPPRDSPPGHAVNQPVSHVDSQSWTDPAPRLDYWYGTNQLTNSPKDAAPVMSPYITSPWPRHGDPIPRHRVSPEEHMLSIGNRGSRLSLDSYSMEAGSTVSSVDNNSRKKSQPKRRSSNRDEFDGPNQYLDKAIHGQMFQEKDLPHLPISLLVNEQDDLLNKVNDCLSQCAFDFVAKYQFPIPLEPDKREVARPGDREWTEWVHLLKRLATKRRIPARVLYGGQIKQFVTVLENSMEMRHAAKHQSRPLKDDRNILQLISAGIQVAKILKDALAMEFLDVLYTETETLISRRKDSSLASNLPKMS